MKFTLHCLVLASATLVACATVSEPMAVGADPKRTAPAQTSSAPCPPPGYDRGMLQSLRDRQFTVSDDAQRNALAVALLGCLGDPDPILRDDIAYTGLATIMRRDGIAHETARAMLDQLSRDLSPGVPEGDGFAQPFAALVLAEVARLDRVSPFLKSNERKGLVSTAADYLAGVSDYRGYSEAYGWRHGVAHGADLAMQLSLNDQVDVDGLRALLDAVIRQVSPPAEHFYIYGEPQRLARPMLFAAQRNLVDAETWRAWFAVLANPAPFDDWQSMYRSQRGLARIHNTRAFAQALHVRVTRNPQIDFGELATQTERLITALP